MRSIPLRLWAMALLSALLQLLPFPLAGPVPLWRRLFCWFCLVPLLWALLFGRDRVGKPLSSRQSACLSYLCGVCWYAGNCYWIYQTMYIYGNLPKPASLGILILFSLYLGLYHALFGWLLGTLRKTYSTQTLLLLSPFVCVAVELARARITGFPWDLLGYTQVENLTLTRLAPWTGVMGLSFVVAAINALWMMRVVVRSRQLAYAGLTAATLLSGFATWLAVRNLPPPAQGKDATAILLQENLKVGAERDGPQETKQQMLQAFSDLSRHTTTDKAQLLIWPEAPALFVDSDPEFRHAMSDLAVEMNIPIIVDDVSIGARNAHGRYDEFNTAGFFRANGSYAGHYDKMHLVPFGEYTPYKPLFFFAGQLLDDLPFVPGEHRTMLDANGKRYGVFICYESIFGDEIRRFVGDGAQVLVNISDDGWYGDTSAPWEHLDMVRMRAMENRRWVLRSTNTGITAAIDPFGRITAQIPRHIRSSLAVKFSYSSDLTFYTRHGDWFAWICAFVTAGAVAFGFTRLRNPETSHVH